MRLRKAGQMQGIRQTRYGQLHGTFRNANGQWIMSVRTDSGKWIEVPHDDVCPPPTITLKRRGMRHWTRPTHIICRAEIRPPIARERVLERLRSGDSLTTSKAVQELNVYGLPRVISELRKIGHDITDRRISVFNRLGDVRIVKEYFIKQQQPPRVWRKG